MSRTPLDPTAASALLAGATARGAIALPNSGYGIVFDNGSILDVRAARILDGDDAASVMRVAARRLAREHAELDALTGGKPKQRDDFELEVPDFVPSVPISDATPTERDEARRARNAVDAPFDYEKEAGW